MSQTSVAFVPDTTTAEGPWLLSRRLDLVLLIGSAVLVPLCLLIRSGLGLSVSFVTLVITVVIGGPHLFATFTYTLMERRFWQRHPYYAAGSLAIPPLVALLVWKFFPLLVPFFFAWASVHILHQVCYLADCYQARHNPDLLGGWRRAVDYAVVFSSLYPGVFFRLVHGTFYVAGQTIRIPYVNGNPIVFILVSSLFIVSLLLYVAKSLWEWKQGRLCLPKTLLILVTVTVAFLLPFPKDLDATFQGFNCWHSLQYLAIAWWINCLRKEKSQISSPFVKSISGPTKTPLFYLSCLIPTLGFLGLIVVLAKSSGIPFNQCYATVIVSGLLAHYYFDHWVFTKVEALRY